MEKSDPQRPSGQQLALLAEVGALLDHEGLDHWLFGGWAVDFHVGAVTRSHSDIDLAVWADDAHAVESVLTASGWEHTPLPDEDGGTGYELRGVRLELTYVVGGENGEVLVALRAGNVMWSESPLGDEVLELDGVRARVIPLEMLRRGKSRPRDDPAEAEIDRADVVALSRPRGEDARAADRPSCLGQTATVILSNDEVEVACDALWFVKGRSAADEGQERLWDRLQGLRTGDFGGSASAEVTPDETVSVLAALRFCEAEIPLDDDEQRLLSRLDSR